MICILLLALTSNVCGDVAEELSQTLYEAEENNNITISWDVLINGGLFLTNLLCMFKSTPQKVLYHMHNGVEEPKSQDEQFAGRIQCDKDNLRKSHIRLHLLFVRTVDAGEYWCDLLTNYENTRKQWLLRATERFVLKVTKAYHGKNGNTSLTTLKPQPIPGSKQQPGGPDQGQSEGADEHAVIAFFVLAGFTALGLFVMWNIRRRRLAGHRCQCQDLIQISAQPMLQEV
ncbi:uncharacterized protein LOC143010678 isoform X2 [Genypterus blacodes]